MSNIIELATVETPSEPTIINNQVISDSELNLLEQINEKYAHVVIGAKHKIMVFKPCAVDGKRMTFESVQDFYNYFAHLPKIAGLNQGKAWFNWQAKRFYADGVGYYPNHQQTPPGAYNAYQGLGVKPLAGEVTLILNHIHQVLCAGDSIASSYFIHWLAHIVQKPEQKPTVAILMKSAEGTGKGTLFKLLKKMFGVNALQVNGSEQITGKFNGLLAGKLLMLGDEVDLTDKKIFNKAKGLISEQTFNMELKGIDAQPVPNYARFIFAGNHSRILRAGIRERRFLVIEPSSCKIDDHDYFKRLNEFIDQGQAAQYFLEHLLHIDLSEFKPFKAPTTKGLIDEKLQNLPPVLAFLHDELSKEKPFANAARIYTSETISQYRHWCETNDIAMTVNTARTQIGKTFSAIGLRVLGRSNRGQGKYYELLNSNDLKEKLAKYLGHKTEDIF